MNVQLAPIGVFDSGLGGLSVALEVRRMLPSERLLYAADSQYCPYGSRTPEEIRWRTLLVTSALIERGVKLLIVACNTACAVVLEELRARFPIPIIGLEPALKPAIEISQSRRVGVLATPTTAASERLGRLIARYAEGVHVQAVPAPGLVELVEAGTTGGPLARAAVQPLIEPLVRDGVDTIVLGCTHYPFLYDAIRAVAGDEIALVDSGSAIARRARDVLAHHRARASEQSSGGLEILTTGDVTQVGSVAARLLSEPVTVEYLPLPVSPDDGAAGYDPPAAAPKLSAACICSVSAGA